MADYFVVRFGEQPDGPVSWIVVDDQGTRRGEVASGSLYDAASLVRERPVIALVPGTEVLTLNTSVPAKGARLLAALPYALEDQLADDVDNLHFAPGKRGEDGRLTVAVVARSHMQAWLDALAGAGLKPARMVPENHGLAFVPNTLSILAADDTIMFNDGREAQFIVPGLAPVDALAAASVLDASMRDADAPRHVLAWCDAETANRYERDWALLQEEFESVDVNLLHDGPLPRLAVTVASGAGINLLQGQYGDRTRVQESLRPWRYAAALLAALLVTGLVAKGVDYYRLSSEQANLQAQFTEEYRRLRPSDEREIVDPVGALNSLRRAQGGSSTGPQVFLPLMLALSEAVRGNDTIVLEAVSYRAGVVDVRLNAPDIPTLDRIVQAVDASGRFVASLQSADTIDERVNSRIQIREAGS